MGAKLSCWSNIRGERMMRVIAFLFLLLSIQCANAQPSAIACHHDSSDMAASAQPVTEIVPAIAGERVGICGYVVISINNAATIQFFLGTGTNCNGTKMIPSEGITMPNNSVLVNRLPNVYSESPPGYAVCVQITGSGTISYILYWEQY